MPNRRPPAAPPPAPKPRPKSTVLVIRIAPEDRALIEAAAAAQELETSTWARQTLVLAAKRWRTHEAAQPPAAAEPRPDRARDAE